MSKFGVTLGPSTRAEPLPSDGEPLPREAGLQGEAELRGGAELQGEARLRGEGRLPGGGAPLARGASVGGVIAGKYRIERVIGHGGMGVVVAATQLALERTVAIKLIRGDWADDPLAVERLVREARALARIQSQHVARVLDVGTLDDGIPFIVMEYLEGHDLDSLLRRNGPLPVTDAVDYLLQACEALAEAHRNGIVHRDVKPANLFLARQPSGVACIKVVDFGISKLINSASVESLTHPSRIVGSLYHMAPEQLSGDLVDARTDVWALGVLLFELLTGRKPFQGGAWPAVFARVLNDSEPPESLGAHVPGELQSVVQRCLQRNPEQRFPNVAELAVALSPFGTRVARVSLEHIVRLATSTGSLAAESHSPLPPGAGAAVGASHAEQRPAASPASTPPPRRAPAPPAPHGSPAPASRPRRGGQWLLVGGAALVVVSVPWLVLQLLRPAAPDVLPVQLPPAQLLPVDQLPAEQLPEQLSAEEAPSGSAEGAPDDPAVVERVPPGRPSPEAAVLAPVPPEPAPGGAEPRIGRILVPSGAEPAPSPPSLAGAPAPPAATQVAPVAPGSEPVAAPQAAGEETAASSSPRVEPPAAPVQAASEAAPKPVQGAAGSGQRGADPWDLRDLEFE